MTTTRPRETYPQMPKRVRFLLFVAVLAIGGCHQSKQVAAQLANFTATTTYAVLIPQAKGVISNAYGPVKARVSPALALSIQFGLVKGPNYAAGLVTATTDTTGRLTKLTKLKQSCRISYNAVTGAVSRVLCTTASRRRALRVGSGHAAENSELDGDDDGTGGLEAAGGRRMELAVGRQHRRLSDCASCASFVSDALATGLQSTACGAAFPRLVPAPHAWAKGAAAAICAVSVNLGLHPISRYTNGVQACRCSCMRNQDCPSTVCYNRPKWEGYCRGFCSDGICLGRPLNDGEPCPDADDDDCFNQRCARDLYPSGPYVCCPSNRYVLEQRLNNWTGEYYCTGQAAGAACFDNAMCARNGVCIGGVCRPSQLEVGESCPERDDGDCSSGACGRISYPAGEYTCCPSGSKVAPGEYPGTEAYCAKSQEVDAPCGSNGMCTTGVCSQGVCFAHPIDVGEPCPDSESNDCVNQACGRESYPSGRHVCCPSNETVRTGYWNGTNSYIYTDYFCASIQVVGAPCEQDGMCSSGICTGGMCLAGPPQTGEACDYRNGNTTENDCLNGVCARSSYPSGDYICCPSNTSKQSIVLFDSFRDEYCTQTQDVGSPCDADEMCSSGVCSGFVCRPRKLDAGEPCDYDGENCSFFECTDCMSGRCARDSFPSGTTVCCDSDKRAWSPSFRAPYCAGIQGDGLACDSDELCSSGVCREFICQASNKTDHVGTLEPYHHKDLQVRCNPTGGEKYPFLVIAYWYYVNTYTTYGLFDLWDPRSGSNKVHCHGAMVARDVFYLHAFCRPFNEFVMVGDSYNNHSVQYRKIIALSEEYPSLRHPQYDISLYKIEPVSFDGFRPVKLQMDSNAMSQGQNLTSIGYDHKDRALGANYEGQAYECPIQVQDIADDRFTAKQWVVGPCIAGTSQLALDSTGALVGLGMLNDFCGLDKEPSYYFRIPPVADWIERNVCGLSESPGELPFCPALVCPHDARLIGYPWALLPNGTGSIKGTQGFDPVRVIQNPPPGTPLWRDTTTNVTFTAFDAAGNQLTCTWIVEVPPLAVVGELEFPIYDDRTSVRLFGSVYGGNGKIFKMTGRLSDRLRGSGASVSARLRKGGDKYTGTLRLANNQTRGAVAFPTLDVKFSDFKVLGVELEVQVKRVTKAATVVYKLYGQEEGRGVGCPVGAVCDDPGTFDDTVDDFYYY